MQRTHLVMLTIVMLAAMGSVREALADAAPPPPPSAGSVESGEYPTMVQMESENVIMTIGDDIAYVKATFNMRNQGTEEEAFDVRFPVDTEVYGADGPELASVYNFAAYVDGQRAEVSYVAYPPDEYCLECQELHWVTWHVNFPTRLPVVLGVIYQVDPLYMGGAFQNYLYTLETGAGWYGSIGEGTITVRLPYEVSDDNTVLNDYVPRPLGYTISGADIIWHFTDLEPTEKDNIRVEILSPRALRDIHSAQRQIDENPDSIDAHVKLARALVDALSFKGGLNDIGNSGEMATQACKAYERALELAPNNIDLNIEYLDLLWNISNPNGPFPTQLLPSLEGALELDPDNERLLQMLDRYNHYLYNVTAHPEQFAWLTPSGGDIAHQTPQSSTPPPFPTSAFTPQPTSEMTIATFVIPTPIPNPLPTSSPTNPPIPLWAAIAATAIGGAGIGVWAYRQRKRTG